MMNDPAVLPRKKPRQRRSQEMVAAIVEATARVLREGGADAVSTNQVAKVAGVSVGSLYQYFPNKEALLQAVAEQHSQEQIARLGALMGGGQSLGPADMVRRYVGASIAVHKDDPVLHLAVTAARFTRGMGPAMEDHEVARKIVVSILHLHLQRGTVDVPDPEQAAWLLVTTVEAAIHMALFQDAAQLDDPRFERELVRMVLRYLGIDEGPDGSDRATPSKARSEP